MKMSFNNSNPSVAGTPAKPSVSASAEALLNLADAMGCREELVKEISRRDRLQCYHDFLTYYRDCMLSDLKDDDECSFHPEEAKKIHSFANGSLKILLSNPALSPGQMVDIMPKAEAEHCYERIEANCLFLFLDTLHDILFPKTQEA